MESKTNYIDLVENLFICFCKVLLTNGSSQGPASESVFGSTMSQRLGRFEVAAGPWHEPFVARSWTSMRRTQIHEKDSNLKRIHALHMSYFKHYKRVGDFIGFL